MTGGIATEASARFASLSTALVADACLRQGLPLRLVPPGIRPVIAGTRVAGRVLPARHCGSVDVFLEAMERGSPGDVLIIDNAGRDDEACIGDLTALEARAAGLAAIVVWGCHRDTTQLLAVELPVWSYGRTPAGPRRLDPRPADALTSARIGEEEVGPSDWVFADEDGVLFVASSRVSDVLEVAASIGKIEREQASQVAAGQTLREQFRFAEFLRLREADPSLTFREHLRRHNRAIEE